MELTFETEDTLFATLSKDLSPDQSLRSIESVLYDHKGLDKKEYDFYFVLDRVFSNYIDITKHSLEELSVFKDEYIEAFKKYILSITGEKVNFMVLASVPFYISHKERKARVIDFYASNRIDFKKYIPAHSVIIPVGRAIYSFTRSDDLDVKSFYDTLFNKSYFYCPEFDSYIYPIDAFDSFGFSGLVPTLKKKNVTEEATLLLNEDDSDDVMVTANTFENHFAQYQIKHALIPPRFPVYKPLEHEVIKKENVAQFLQAHAHVKEVAWDIETDGLDPFTNKIGCITLSFTGHKGYYFDFYEEHVPLWDEFFKNKFLIGTNLKFDVEFTRQAGIESTKVDFDTLNAGHLLNEMRRNGLKPSAWIYTPYGGYDYALDEYKKEFKKKTHAKADSFNYMKIPESIRVPYACNDPCVSMLTYKEQIKEFDYQEKLVQKIDNRLAFKRVFTLEEYYFQVVVPAINMFVDIELTGMCVNWDRVREVGNEMLEEIARLKNAVYKKFDIPESLVDIDSSEQLGIFLEEYAGYNILYRSDKVLKKKSFVTMYQEARIAKDPKYMLLSDQERKELDKYYERLASVDKIALKEWIRHGEFGAQEIADYKELITLYHTFVGSEATNKGIWQYRKPDGRIHSNFWVMLAKSHRFRSSKPNLQNLPKHGKWAKTIREFFSVPDDSFMIGDLDYSAFQLRIATLFSHDPEMEKIFTSEDGDMHSITAQAILKQEVDLKFFKEHKKDLFENERFKAKAINFSLLFGSSPFAFAMNSLIREWEEKEFDEYIQKFDLKESVDDKINYLITKGFDRIPFSKVYASKIASAWAVATHIREAFLEKYKGLKIWIQNQISFAEDYGFVVSVHGAIRRLPELQYYKPFHHYQQKKMADGLSRSHIFSSWTNRSSFKKHHPGAKHFIAKNLQNIALNSPVQNFEVVTMVRGMLEVYQEMKKRNMRSKFIGMVHDSNVQYIAKEEKDEMKELLKRMEQYRPEFEKIPMLVEASLADYSNNEFWGTKSDQSWF